MGLKDAAVHVVRPGETLADGVRRTGVAQVAGRGLVDDHRLDTGGPILGGAHGVAAVATGEEPPRQRLQAIELEEAEADVVRIEVHQPASGQVHVGHQVVGQGRVLGTGDARHAWQGGDLPHQGVRNARRVDHQHLVAVEPQAFPGGEHGLAPDHHRRHDQADEDGELEGDQALAQHRPAGAAHEPALEHAGRPETGQHHRRIGPGQDSGQDHQAEQHRQGEHVGEGHVAAEEGVEARHQRLCPSQGDHAGQGRVEQGLADELDNQVAPLRPGQLAHPDLDRAPARPRRHQVHEVDRPHQHDQHADQRHRPGRRHIAPRRHGIRGGRREMDRGQRRDLETVVVTLLGVEDDGQMPVDQPRYAVDDRTDGLAWTKADVGVGAPGLEPSVVRHVVHAAQFGERGLGRGHHRQPQVGVGRQVLDHRRHPHRIALVDQEGAADGSVGPEVLPRQGAAQHHRVRLGQGGLEVAGHRRQRQDLEDVRIGPCQGFEGLDLAITHEAPVAIEPAGRLDLREIELHPAGKVRRGVVGSPGPAAAQLGDIRDEIGVPGSRYPLVEAEFVADEDGDEQGGDEGDRQTADADQGVEPVVREVAQGGDEITSEHLPSLAPPADGQASHIPPKRDQRTTVDAHFSKAGPPRAIYPHDLPQ